MSCSANGRRVGPVCTLVEPPTIILTAWLNRGAICRGSRLPMYGPEKLPETRPDYVLILPWNLRDEIVAKMAPVRDWGGRFVVPIPTTTLLP